MLRAPLAFLVAVLALAAVGCSRSVPPPGATLSGFVYADDNANGVRDSCDSGKGPGQIATVSLVPLGDRGVVREVNTARGPWKIDKVAPGDYQLVVDDSLQRPFWSVTGPARKGTTPGYSLSVKGYEVVDGLDFGVLALGASLEIVFGDTDGDGKMDEQECPIDEGEHERLTSGLWEFTTPGEDGGCRPPGGYRPQGSQAPLRVGIREATGTSIGIVRVFEDEDGDGEREDGEPLLPEAEVSLSTVGPCLFGTVAPSSSEEDEVVFSKLPAGNWSISVQPVSCLENCWDGPEIVITTPYRGREAFGWADIVVGDGETREVDFGFQILAPSRVHAEVVEDVNRDGRASPGEPRVAGIPVCWGPPREAVEYPDGYSPGDRWESCQESNRDGVVDFGRVFEGVRRFGIDLPTRLETVWIPSEPFVDVTVRLGETLMVTLLIHRP